jgi:hypothetical protein
VVSLAGVVKDWPAKKFVKAEEIVMLRKFVKVKPERWLFSQDDWKILCQDKLF